MTDNDWKHINDIAAAISSSLNKYGPQAWNIAKQIKQIDSLGQILPSLIFLFIGLALIPLLVWGWKNAKQYEEDHYDSGGEAYFGMAIPSIGVMLSIIIPLCNLTNVWLWIGIFQPALAIAHDAMQKALGQ